MIVSTESLWDALAALFESEYEVAAVYGDVDEDTVLHEGPARVRANGWVELPAGRLLSPEAVHHIDVAAVTAGWVLLDQPVAADSLVGFLVIVAGFALLKERELAAELAHLRGATR